MRSRDERGQDTIEYIGVLAVVALIIALVFGSGLGDTIARATSHEVGVVLGVGWPGGGSGHGPGAVRPSGPVVSPATLGVPGRAEPAPTTSRRSVPPHGSSGGPVAHPANYVLGISPTAARTAGRVMATTGRVAQDLPLPNLVASLLSKLAGKYVKDVGEALLQCGTDRQAISCVISIHTVKVLGLDTHIPDGVVKVYTITRRIRKG